jgi:hypothetical protein
VLRHGGLSGCGTDGTAPEDPSTARPVRTRMPAPRAAAAASVSSRDFPTPASPVTSRTRPASCAAATTQRRTAATSAARPTMGDASTVPSYRGTPARVTLPRMAGIAGPNRWRRLADRGLVLTTSAWSTPTGRVLQAALGRCKARPVGRRLSALPGVSSGHVRYASRR